MTHPDRSKRLAGRRSFTQIASVSHAIGTKLLTVCSGSFCVENQWEHHPDNATPAAWKEMCDEFGHLIEVAEAYDIFIGIEPELSNIVNSANRARELIDTMQSERLRIVFDPANLFETEDEEARKAIIETGVDLLHNRIVLAHAKDRLADGEFTTTGKGVIDYHHYLSLLHSIDFRGALITYGLSSDDAPGVAAFLKAQLDNSVALS